MQCIRQSLVNRASNMKQLQVYGHPFSAPFRSVAVTLAYLGIDYEYKFLDVPNGDHRKPEYIKLNPQHNIPLLVAPGGFKLNESRAIAVYLAQRYDPQFKLYPADVEMQAIINQRLWFDSSSLFQTFRDIFLPMAFMGQKEIGPGLVDRLKELLGWLEDYLKPTGFIAGTPGISLADLTTLATYATIDATGKTLVDLEQFPLTRAWFERMKAAVPNYEKVNGELLAQFRDFLKEKTDLVK